MNVPITTTTPAGLAAALTAALLVPNLLPRPSTELPRSAAALPRSAVVEFHENLLAALDRGNATAARRFFVTAPSLLVVDRRGQPVTLVGSHAVDNLVASWAFADGDPEPTELVSCSVAANNGASSVVVFELERPVGEVRLLRGTSVLTKSHDRNGTVLKVQHLHVSPAERQDY